MILVEIVCIAGQALVSATFIEVAAGLLKLWMNHIGSQSKCCEPVLMTPLTIASEIKFSDTVRYEPPRRTQAPSLRMHKGGPGSGERD